MVRFECILDEKSLKKFNRNQMEKTWIVLFFMSMVFLLIAVINFLNEENFRGAIFLSVGILFAPCILLIGWILSKRNKGRTVKNLYVFDQENVTVESVTVDFHTNSSFKYSQIIRIEETLDSYYMFISKNQAYIIDKVGLQEGTLDELNAIFKANLQEKYKMKK